MNYPRTGLTLTKLQSGEVLAAGGTSQTAAAELYNPATNTWTLVGALNCNRSGHVAVLLPNGNVFLATPLANLEGSPLCPDEVFSPSTNSFSVVGAGTDGALMVAGLGNGEVLEIGSSSSQIYNSATSSYQPAASPPVTHDWGVTALLQDGRLMLIGGLVNGYTYQYEVDAYSPSTNTWAPVHPAPAATTATTAAGVIVLANGQVVVCGGAQIQVYTPSTDTWSIFSAFIGDNPLMAQATDGNVYALGGSTVGQPQLPSGAGLFVNPASLTQSSAANLLTPRLFGAIADLGNGQFLVAGGETHSDYEIDAEIYYQYGIRTALTSPASGAILSGTASLTATASDDVGVSSVSFYDGANLLGTVSASPYQLNWNSRSAANGTHTLTSQATDAAGHLAVSSPVTVTLNNDLTPPTASITSWASGAAVGGVVTITAAASDNVAVASVSLSIDGILFGALTAAPYAWSWPTVGLADGAHTLSAVATDTSGNVSSPATITVTTDNTGPSVAFTDPASEAYVGGRVTVTVAASDPDGVALVALALDGAPLTQLTSAPYTYAWVSGTVADGSHTLTASGTDTLGNVGAPASVTVQVVNGAPSVALTSPANLSAVGGTVEVQTSTDGGAPIASVAFALDGGAPFATSTAAPFQTSWNTTSVAGGWTQLSATAQDAVGNTATTSVSVFVDNLAPTAAISSPANGAVVTGTVGVTAAATDNFAVASVTFLVDGAPVATVTSVPYTWSWVTTGAADGAHTLAVSAKDEVGNVSPVSSSIVTVDNHGPAVSFQSPTAGGYYKGTIAVSMAASGPDGVGPVTLAIDGTQVKSWTQAPYTYSWNSSGAALGSHTLTATATDALGLAQTTTETISLYSGSPSIKVTAPKNMGYVAGTVAIQLTVTAGAPIALVEVWGSNSLACTLTAPPWVCNWNSASVPDAFTSIEATVWDAAGNAVTASNSITVENTPPSVTLTAPTEKPYFNGTVTVSGTVSYPFVVPSEGLAVDGVTAQTVNGSVSGFNWNSANLPDGTHTVAFLGINSAGVVGSASETITTDNTPPAVTLTAPVAAAYVRGTVGVSANVSDNVQVASVTGGAGSTNLGALTAPPFSWSWNTTASADGSQTVDVWATDEAGNQSTKSLKVTVDNTPPTVAITKPAVGAVIKGTTTLTTNAKDNIALAQASISVDEATVCTVTASPFSCSWNSTTVANGSHTVSAVALDKAGNTTTSATVPFTVSN